jgi:uncharacterized C2H2 Zn-finger protein
LKRHINSRHKSEQNVEYELTQNVSPVTQNVNQLPQIVNQLPQIVNQLPQIVNQLPQNVNHVPHTFFACDKCEKVFTRKDNLHRHMLKCTGNKLQCPQCNRMFETRQARSKHIKTCKYSESREIVPSEDNNQTLVPINNTHIQNAHNVINANTVQNAHNLVNNNNNNNIHFHINNFGSEDLSHITAELLDRRLKELHGKGIGNLVTDVHFHPDKPENHNVRINSRKYKTMCVKQDNEWRIRSNDEVLDFMMMKYKDMLVSRLYEKDFQKSLRYESDFEQIQRDISSIDKRKNPQDYYAAIHRILAAMEDLDRMKMKAEGELIA